MTSSRAKRKVVILNEAKVVILNAAKDLRLRPVILSEAKDLRLPLARNKTIRVPHFETWETTPQTRSRKLI